MKILQKIFIYFSFFGLILSGNIVYAKDSDQVQTCTFKVVNDFNPSLPPGVTPTFQLTAVDPAQNAYQWFHWDTSTLQPGGTITFTSNSNIYPFCFGGGGNSFGPRVTFMMQWYDNSKPGQGPYFGFTFSGGLQNDVTNLSKLSGTSWSQSMSGNVTPVPTNPG